jgi:WD40 repeat protein
MHRNVLVLWVMQIILSCGTMTAQSPWVLTSITGRVDAVACSPQGVLFAFGTRGSIDVDTVYRSIDSGATWTRTGAIVPAGVNQVCFPPKGRIYAGSSSGGILRLTDNGDSWVSLRPPYLGPLSLATNRRGEMFAGDYGYHIFRSTDNDTVWTSLKTFSGPVLNFAFDSSGSIAAAVRYIYGGTPSYVV